MAGVVVRLSLKARGVSAVNSYITYGTPSLFTYWGFIHSLCLKNNISLVNETILPIVHRFENREIGGVFDIQRTSSKQIGRGATLVDMPRCDIDFSIIFKIEADDLEGIADDLQKSITSMSFNSGFILKDSIEIKLSSLSDEKLLLLSTPKGYIQNEYESEIEYKDDSGEYLKQFLYCLSPSKEKKGWITPTLIGYAPIEDSTKRNNVRFDYEHQFAEPIIGLVEFKIFKKAYNDNEVGTTLDNNGWSLSVNDEYITFKQQRK